MIQNYHWTTNEWVDTGHKLLKDFIKAHSHNRPCKIQKTNQDDFDNVFLYYFDSMGHMFLIRMNEDDYHKEWYNTNLYEEQRKDYDIFTDQHGYVSKTPHIICGKCDRCKTCGDCKCEDKHGV